MTWLKGLILRQEVEDRDERERQFDCSSVNEEHSRDIPSRSESLYPTRWVLRRHGIVGRS